MKKRKFVINPTIDLEHGHVSIEVDLGTMGNDFTLFVAHMINDTNQFNTVSVDGHVIHMTIASFEVDDLESRINLIRDSIVYWYQKIDVLNECIRSIDRVYFV